MVALLAPCSGMVAPLALVALAWDRRRERAALLLSDRRVRLRLGRWQRETPLGTAAGGLLMVGMGVLSVVLAFTGPGMPSGGWQTELSAWLQHLSASAQGALGWIPGWVLAAALLGGFALLIRRAHRSPTIPAATTTPGGGDDVAESSPMSVTVEENRREQEQR